MYEYVCNHIIPGCTYHERGGSREEVEEQAMKHIAERHPEEDLELIKSKVSSDAMIFIPR